MATDFSHQTRLQYPWECLWLHLIYLLLLRLSQAYSRLGSRSRIQDYTQHDYKLNRLVIWKELSWDVNLYLI